MSSYTKYFICYLCWLQTQGMRKSISAYPAIKGIMSDCVTKEQALIRIQRALMNEVTFPIVRLGILDEVPIEGRKLAVFLFLFQEFRRKSFVLERLHKQGKSLMKFLGGQSLLVICVSSRVLIQSEHAFRSRYPIVSNVFFPSSWARKRKLTVNFQNRGRRKPWGRCGSPARRDGHHSSNYHKEPWRCLFQSTGCLCRWACGARLS